jgi:hypothetical protein
MSIRRYEIRQEPNGYTSIHEDELATPDAILAMANEDAAERDWSSYSWHMARCCEAERLGKAIWLPVGGVGGYSLDITDKARRKLTSKMMRQLDEGKQVTIYACIY